jgi:hypothetical protein
MSLSKPQRKRKVRYKHANLIVEKAVNAYQSKQRPDVTQIEVQNIRKLFGFVRSGFKSECVCSSSSSSGPGAYAPDAPQPIGLLCDPCSPVIFLDIPTSAARRLHVRTTRETLAAKGGTVDKNVGL